MIVELATVGAMYMADASAATSPMDYINPVTIVIKGGEKIMDHLDKRKEKELSIPKESSQKFKAWEKEDFYKDDNHKDMWDPNWIKKS
jgi:hypothetical protein